MSSAIDSSFGWMSPLVTRADQSERWVTHDGTVSFEQASDWVREAHASDGARSDVVVHDLRSWALTSLNGAMALAPVPIPGRVPRAHAPLRELAYQQLCQRVAAPAGYVRGLPAKLQAACLNWGMAQSRQPAVFRLAGDEVRAIVSDRYAPLDDAMLLETLHEVLARAGYLDDVAVRATAVGAHTLLRITLPSDGVAVRVGDVIEHGIDIANSELGLRSVQITPVTYRLACTNGLRAWKSEASLRLRHVGDPRRLREELRDALPVAFAEARGDLARWARASEVLVDSVLEDIESLRQFGLSQGDTHAIGRALLSERGALPANASVETLSELLEVNADVFEVTNAITAVARESASTSSRLALEEAGHRYFTRRVG